MRDRVSESVTYVDRPRPRLPLLVWLFAIVFMAFFVAVPMTSLARSGMTLAAIGWLVLSLVGGALIGSSYFAVRYEIADGELRARAGLSRAHFQLADVTTVEIAPWYTFVRRRNLGRHYLLINSWAPMLRIVDTGSRTLVITPTNPEEMRDEILRRRDALRGGSDA
ncbi:MAG: PH domain-containing protein [Chloroflexi bacterium]|nr:PH domain-containing protein [Chloroflexota bacterium]MDA1145328.1 PH domain-containing protein [Chloroflexota bacterium]